MFHVSCDAFILVDSDVATQGQIETDVVDR